MFYAKYLQLCANAGVSPSAAAEAMGLRKSAVTKWKNGSTPSNATLVAIANYFEVDVQQLRDFDEKKPIPEDELNDRLRALLSKLRPEEVIRAEAYIEGMIANRE